MKNKMFIILGSIIVLFIALYFVVDYKNKQAIDISGNPYGKDELKQETIDQLDDPMYQNQITPDVLEEKLANGEDMTVYFYSPTCIHCQRATPILVPLAEELNVDIKKLNLLEFEDEWATYDIEGTPTLVHYVDGEEVERISGEQSEEVFRSFLTDHVVKK